MAKSKLKYLPPVEPQKKDANGKPIPYVSPFKRTLGFPGTKTEDVGGTADQIAAGVKEGLQLEVFMNESGQYIAELSKNTLKSYVGKAAVSAAVSNDYAKQNKRNKRSTVMVGAGEKKRDKRLSGILAATKQLGKKRSH